jgi:hypothetical protein
MEYNTWVTAIRVIFDGKAFIPQQPVSLPAQSEAIVLVDSMDQAERKRLDDEIRAYYQSGSDSEDDWPGSSISTADCPDGRG